MRRLTMTLLVVLAAAVVLATPASAARTWCAKDPIVALNGTPVQIWVSIPDEYVPYVNGPIQMTISTPASVSRQIQFLDSGFNGYGETIEWRDLGSWGLLTGWRPATVAADGSFDVTVQTVVPVNKNLLFNLLFRSTIPLRLTIVFEDGTTKTVEMTNDGARVSFRVQGR